MLVFEGTYVRTLLHRRRDTTPKDPRFRKRFGPRGVLRCKASDTDDPTVDEQFGRVGMQVIEDTGPLTKKRMETVDEEFIAAALDFMERKTTAE